jgi:hypothetical protein
MNMQECKKFFQTFATAELVKLTHDSINSCLDDPKVGVATHEHAFFSDLESLADNGEKGWAVRGLMLGMLIAYVSDEPWHKELIQKILGINARRAEKGNEHAH